jgi:chromate transporter
MEPGETSGTSDPSRRVPLRAIVRSWLRLGITGFGGPQAHVVLLRQLVVERQGWIPADEFEHAVATTNLLPGPASTQLAIYCAWRLRRATGALVGGVCFILPGLALIIAASAAVLASGAPSWVLGAALGAGAVVPAIALRAGMDLVIPSFKRSRSLKGATARWSLWLLIGLVATVTIGPALVLALLGCGAAELAFERWRRRAVPGSLGLFVPALATSWATSIPLAWTALKVGALSFGGGFVIIPLMQSDAVHRYHWMTSSQFLTGVALGQLTPGPVVQTVAVVGYAAGGFFAAVLAAVIAFAPSFAFVILGGPSFERLRHSIDAQAFLAGAGPAAIGAIAGTAVLLGLDLSRLWQLPVLVGAALWLLIARRSTTIMLLVGAVLGIGAAACGLPI